MGTATAAESVDRLNIPVIDISGHLAGDVQATASIVSSIASAAQSPGFFQITGHKVPSRLTSQVLEQYAAFFALPDEVKSLFHRTKSPGFRGYEAIGEQSLEKGFIDYKEGFTIGLETPPEVGSFFQGPNQWPELGGFKEVLLEYFDELLGLSKVLCRLMALSLSLREDYFDGFVSSEYSLSAMRALRYPPTTPEMAASSRGIGAHTDFGALTLLLQDGIGGLEVFHRPTETWHPVTPIDGAFVVNIGDMLERWTNRHYTSTVHRVIRPVSGQYRYSVAFFNHGPPDQVIECISSFLKPGEEPLYEPVLVEMHLRSRVASSY